MLFCKYKDLKLRSMTVMLLKELPHFRTLEHIPYYGKELN